MDRRLQIGLLFMLAAVVVLPLAFLLKGSHEQVMLVLVIFTMLMEVAGLVLVIVSLWKGRK